MTQVKKLLGHREKGQDRNAGFGRSGSARRGGALRSSSAKKVTKKTHFKV
jgi:hypothetical protein